MDGWLWVALALLAVAVMIQASAERSRVRRVTYLGIGAIGICVAVHLAISGSRLTAAEEAAASGQPVAATLATWLESHYEIVLLPLYVVAVMLLIELLTRLALRFRERAVFANQRGMIMSALANLLVFVAAPSLFYFAAVNVTASSSILSDAAASPLRPFVAAYGTPAYWTSSCFDQCKPTLKQSSSRPWPWNRYYSLTTRITGRDWLRDVGPWIALSLLLACAGALKAANRSQSVSLGSYFRQPAQEGRDKSLAARTPIGPWRARVLAALVVVVGLPLVAAILMVYLVAYLTYIMMATVVMAALLIWVWRSYMRPRKP